MKFQFEKCYETSKWKVITHPSRCTCMLPYGMHKLGHTRRKLQSYNHGPFVATYKNLILEGCTFDPIQVPDINFAQKLRHYEPLPPPQ